MSGLHILPLILFLVTVYRQGFNHAYFKSHKDQMYGFETVEPTLLYVVFLIAYYGAWAFFTFVV